MEIHIFGASNPTGEELIKMISESNGDINLNVYSRKTKINYLDLLDPNSFEFINGGSNGILVSLSPIWLFASFMSNLIKKRPSILKNIKYIIAISSSSVITKRYAYNLFDRNLVYELQKAEEVIKDISLELNIPCQIICPTLIFGKSKNYEDNNLSFIKKLVKYTPFLILPKNTGLRQPVHCYQLALLIFEKINEIIKMKIKKFLYLKIAVGGDEEICYLKMIKKYCLNNNKKIFIFLPNRVFMFLLSPLVLFSPKYYESLMRITTDLSGFTKINTLMKKNILPTNPYK